MIFGCCKICESVICGPGYCLLLPPDAATVLFPLTPKHKHTKIKPKKTQNSTIPSMFSSVSSFISWSPLKLPLAATIGDKNSVEQPLRQNMKSGKIGVWSTKQLL